MITLGRESDDLDFKDLVTVINPQSVKGLSVLTWTYISPNRDQDVWLWLPSLRKIRRVSQSDGDDSFIGADSTYRVVQKLCNVFLDILSMFCIMKVWKQQNILSLKFGNEP